jgi:hypothetical protein
MEEIRSKLGEILSQVNSASSMLRDCGGGIPDEELFDIDYHMDSASKAVTKINKILKSAQENAKVSVPETAHSDEGKHDTKNNDSAANVSTDMFEVKCDTSVNGDDKDLHKDCDDSTDGQGDVLKSCDSSDDTRVHPNANVSTEEINDLMEAFMDDDDGFGDDQVRFCQ